LNVVAQKAIPTHFGFRIVAAKLQQQFPVAGRRRISAAPITENAETFNFRQFPLELP